MEQHALKYVNNFLNANLEAYGGQSYNLYLNIVHFFNARVNYTSVAAKTVVFLHWCLICKKIF